ncbi:MAG: hypothetical protein KJS64_04950 [Acidobacteria bacterium]|nr:hypothetical protein [Acidobacteriota bacterium]
MGDADKIEELADVVARVAEDVADLALAELRAQANGDESAKAREKLLASARRSLMKAEHSLRAAIRS